MSPSQKLTPSVSCLCAAQAEVAAAHEGVSDATNSTRRSTDRAAEVSALLWELMVSEAMMGG